MRLERIAGLAFDHFIGRMLRRVLLAATIAICAFVAVYQFTVAGSLVLAARFGFVEAHLIVGAIYAFLGLAAAAAAWAMRGRAPRLSVPATLASQREMKLIMLVEAAMLGYTLARKAPRTS